MAGASATALDLPVLQCVAVNVTLKTMHGFLIQSNDSDVIQIGGNTDDPPITKVYSNIMMNSRRILNLPSVAMKQRQNADSHKQLFLMTDNMSGRLVMGVMGVITPSVDIQCWRRVGRCAGV